MAASANRLGGLWLVALAVLVSAAWPLSTYAWGPLVLPMALGMAVAIAVIAARPEYGIALVLALSPFTNAIVAGHKPLHLLLPALSAGILALGLLGRPTNGGPVTTRAATIATSAFTVALALSTLFALDPAKSVNRFFGLLTAALLFYAVGRICRERRQLLVVAMGAVMGLGLAALQGIVDKLTGVFWVNGAALINGEIVERITGSFGHPNQFAGYLAFLIPLGAAFASLTGVPGRARITGGAVALAALYPLQLTYTRGAAIGLLLGGILWLVVVRPRVALPAAITIVGLLVFAAPAAVQDRLREHQAGEVGVRTDLWSSALVIYAEHPVLGSGPNNFSVAYGALPAVQSTGAQRRLLHQGQILLPPHAANLYLTVLAEGGLVGASALLLLLGTATRVAVAASRVRDPVGRAVGIGFGAGVVTVLIQAMLDITLIGETAQVFFALFAVCAALVARDRAQPQPN